MVAPHGVVWAMVLVTPEVTQCSQRSLDTHRVCFAIQKIVCACFHRGCLLGAAPIEVAGSSLVLWRWLAQACSCRDPWLEPGLAKVFNLGLVP